jgi:hypothetical protein
MLLDRSWLVFHLPEKANQRRCGSHSHAEKARLPPLYARNNGQAFIAFFAYTLHRKEVVIL